VYVARASRSHADRALGTIDPEDPVKALLVDEAVESMSELYNGAPSHEIMEEKLK